MSLLETMRTQVKEAMKAGPTAEVTKSILSQIISEAQRLNVADDEDLHKIVRKLVEGNDETLRLGGPNPRLEEENQILKTYLPRTLSVQEIRGSLEAVADQMRAAKSSGQATGIAMKHLKSLGSSANGKDVTLVVEEIRGVLNENQPPAS